jgi:DNA repair protein RecO (recombination protein O)
VARGDESLVMTRALLLRAVPFRESDVVASYLTEHQGQLALMVRGGRASRKRVGGTLEPFHTVSLRYTEAPQGRELGTLRDAEVVRVRAHLTQSLACLEVGGRALRWARAWVPARSKEAEVYRLVEDLLESLDAAAQSPDDPTARAEALLAMVGVELLGWLGYGLELRVCVRCGAERPEGRSGIVYPTSGGLLCRRCVRQDVSREGSSWVLPGAVLDPLGRGEPVAFEALRGHAAARLLELVEEVMRIHVTQT